jgi:D-alanine-D-alanine ligase
VKVLVLHAAPPAVVDAGRLCGEFDVAGAASGVAAVLPGCVVEQARGEPREILSLVDRHAPDVVYNLCEAPLGRPDFEAHVAGLFEWAGVRFTGSGSETLALCRRKDWTAAVLTAANVPVPGKTGFPRIVKPADEDGSAWIDTASICDDDEALARAAARIPGRAVVEQFLPGREFAVSLWGHDHPEHASVGETVFLDGLRLITYQAKWDVESADFRNSPLSYDLDLAPDLRAAVESAARGAWRAVGARGCLRVDVRLDAGGTPRVLDVNPNPEAAPHVGIHRAVVEAGWTWERFVQAQLSWA